MFRYVVSRLALWIPSVLLVLVGVYALAFYGAGDPIKLIFMHAPGDVAYDLADVTVQFGFVDCFTHRTSSFAAIGGFVIALPPSSASRDRVSCRLRSPWAPGGCQGP